MNTFIKRTLISILTRRSVTAIATRLFGTMGVPVFMLHRMSPENHPTAGRITPAYLRRCLNYLVDNGYIFTSIEHLVIALKNGESLPPRAVAFTIDDGYADQAEIAAPIFLEFGCPLTFFVITGMLDQTLWPWDAQVSWIFESSKQHSFSTNITGQPLTIELKTQDARRLARRRIQDAIRDVDADLVPDLVKQLAQDANTDLPDSAPSSYPPMNWDMARRLEQAGVQFAPHSVTHNILSKLTTDSLENEIIDSWVTLKQELANPLKVFCYPTGRATDFGIREIRALKDKGFLGAVSTIPGFVESGHNPEDQSFELPRFALPESMSDFIQCCTWIEYVKSSRWKSATIASK